MDAAAWCFFFEEEEEKEEKEEDELALFSLVVLRPLMLDIMAGTDQKDSFMRRFGGVDVVWWCKFLSWWCLMLCMGQRYADEGKIHQQFLPVPLTLGVFACTMTFLQYR